MTGHSASLHPPFICSSSSSSSWASTLFCQSSNKMSAEWGWTGSGCFYWWMAQGGRFFTGGWLGGCKVCLTGLAGCKGAVKCSEARWRGSGYGGKGTSGRSWHRKLAHTPQHMNTFGQTNTNGEWADKIKTRYFSR